MTEIRHPEPSPAEVVVATAEDVDCGELREARRRVPDSLAEVASGVPWLVRNPGGYIPREAQFIDLDGAVYRRCAR